MAKKKELQDSFTNPINKNDASDFVHFLVY